MSPEELPEPSDRRATGTRRKAPREVLSSAVGVLIVDHPQGQAKIRETIAIDQVELSFASDLTEALEVASVNPPDAVFVEHTLIEGVEAASIERLRDVTGPDVPIVLLELGATPVPANALQAMGASASLGRPFGRETFERLLIRLESTATPPQLPALGSLTVAELADRATSELRRGLMGALKEGHGVPVDFGEGSELLASLWNAIGRMRATAAELSEGAISFDDLSGVPLVTVGEHAPTEEHDRFESFLAGCTVIVADDDPSVLWFFSGLLREAGARVIEAIDGQQALVAALRDTPDLIVADILMPRLDGLGLCRALRRDPLLDSVPVIVLSWREDFLERMRELRAGAEAYLRKEAGGQQILAQVERTLQPWLRLKTQLRSTPQVRGRTETTGLALLLKTVALVRPDALVSIRDAASFFELTYHEGRLVEASQTAIDGSFVRGPQALRPLVGAGGGRFIVTKAQTNKTYETDLEDAFTRAVEDVRDAVDAVRGSELRSVSSVQLDPDILTSFLKTSPPQARSVAERLAAGSAPSELVDMGGVDRELVEAVLLALARRAGVNAVRGLEGEDRILLAAAKRVEHSERRDNHGTSPGQSAIEWEATQDLAPDLRSDFDRMLGSSNGNDVDALLRDTARAEAALAIQNAPTNRSHRHNTTNIRDGKRLSPAPAYHDRPGLLGWSFVLVVALVAAFLGWRTYELRNPAAAPPGEPSADTERAADQPQPVARPKTVPSELDQLGLARFAGVLRPGVPEGLAIGDDEGALIIEASSSPSEVAVFVDNVEVGLAPLEVALLPGRHEVAFVIRDDVFYRFAYIHPGKSRVLSVP